MSSGFPGTLHFETKLEHTMFIRRVSSVCAIVSAAICLTSAQTGPRPLALEDLERMNEVRDPQCSPDSRTVAFVVSSTDAKEDKSHSHIWMVDIDGQNERQVTSSQDSESSPKFSPDGRYLSFTSSRPGAAKGNQVWLLDRRGGEAVQLTDLKGRLQGYEWSPDSKSLAMVVGDPDPDSPDGATNTAAGEGGGRGKPPKLVLAESARTARTLPRVT